MSYNMLESLSDKILNGDFGDTPQEIMDFYKEEAEKKLPLQQLALLTKRYAEGKIEASEAKSFFKHFYIYPMSIATYILQFGLVLTLDHESSSYSPTFRDSFKEIEKLIKLANEIT